MRNSSSLSEKLAGKSACADRGTNGAPPPGEMVFSFRDYDQGQGRALGEREHALSPMLERLKEYSRETFTGAEQNALTIHGEFPKSSGFKYPNHVAEDALWASLRTRGGERILGHLIGATFYVVFLGERPLGLLGKASARRAVRRSPAGAVHRSS